MTEVTVPYRFVCKRDTAANFAAANTLLKSGEIGVVTDANPRVFKIGDGTTRWNSLPAEGILAATASGTNTLTATFVPKPVLFDGMLLLVRAAGANTGAVTFNPNSLGALGVKKQGGTALAAGDIAAAGHELLLRYVVGSPSHYELLNPQGVIVTPTGTGFRHVTAGVEDAAAVTIDGQSTLASGDVKVVAPATHAAPGLTTLLGGDEFTLWDTLTSALAKVTWTNLAANILALAVTAGSSVASFVKYNGTTKAAGQFDGGAVNPSHSTRLNFDGNLYATAFFGDGSNLSGITGAGVSVYSLPATVQPSVARGTWQLLRYIPGTATADQLGWIGGTTQGTAGSRSLTNTNTFSRKGGRPFTSAATAGSSGGAYQTVATGCAADGFYVVFSFGAGDAAAVAQARSFVGLRASVAAFANANPTTFTDCIGVGNDSGDANMHIIYNDSSGTASSIDLGASFPANTLNVDWYIFELYCAPGSTTVDYCLQRSNTGDIAKGTLSSDLPGSTTQLAAGWWRNNGTTALATTIMLAAVTYGSNLR